MFRHSLKLALRNLKRNKVFSFISITGLSIGMASSLLIFLMIENQFSVDQFHIKKDRIYVVYNQVPFDGQIASFAGTSSLLAPVIASNFPQAEEVVRVHYVANFIFNVGDKHLESSGILTDKGFLNTFSFPLVQGDTATALSDPRSIVLSASYSKKLFGNTDALGQTVRVDSNAVFTVRGIAEDAPENSRFRFDYLIPYSYRKEVNWDILKWDDYSVETFVLLKPGVNYNTLSGRLKNVIRKNANELKNELFLYPFTRYYMHGRFENGKEAGGRIEHIERFGLIGIFILLIACINYVNLSTAASFLRAREVGIKKVVGARRWSLIGQFIIESILVAALAGMAGLGIAQLCLQLFNELVFTQLSIPYTNLFFWLKGALFIIFTGLFAGVYPAVVLSSFQPIRTLKGLIKTVQSTISPRKVLVVFQFSFAIVFIICTIVVYLQIRLGQQMNPGYDMHNLVYVFLRGDLSKKFDVVRDELYRSGAITSVTRTNSPVTMFWSSSDSYVWPKKDPNLNVSIPEYHSDVDFARTMGIKVIAGRDINSVKYASDSTAVMLNEAAVDLMKLTNPIGQVISNQDGNWRIVGVVKNFIVGNPYAPPEPLIIQGPKNWLGTVTFRLNPYVRTSTALQQIGDILKKYNPDYPFSFIFVDEDYQEKFSGTRSLAKLALLFAVLAIIISCLGLYALGMHMANTRTKEIGIRKVLGASVLNITALMSKDFVQLIMISFVVASPIAWWMMNAWLQDFTYRISISWWIFVLTAMISVLVALVTISFHAIKAATANPVNNLRTE